MDITTLISYIVEYVDDIVIEEFIKFVFDKKQIYNPYNTYKELFLHFVLFPQDNLGKNCINPGVYDEDRKKFYTDFTKIYDINDEECINSNTYAYILSIFKGNTPFFKVGNQKFFNPFSGGAEQCQDVLIDYYNEIFIDYCSDKFDENNIFYRYLYLITKTLNGFNINNKLICSKDFLNKVIIDLVKNERIYILGHIHKTDKILNKWVRCYYVTLDNTIPIEKQLKNTEEFEYWIAEKSAKNTIYFSEKLNMPSAFPSVIKEKLKNYTTITCDDNSKGKHSLLGAKTIDSYINSIKSLDIALDKLKEKIKNKDSCHICNPTKKNTPKNKSHMCKKCDRLVKAIQKNDLKQTQVVYAIKRKDKGIENCKNTDDIRILHYKNLTDFLTELYNANKIRNKKEIVGLINNIFKDYGEFNF